MVIRTERQPPEGGKEGILITQIYNLRLNKKAREWCMLPYLDHPQGCPNYGRKPTCPPIAPHLEDFFDITQPLYLIAVGFNLGKHIEQMLEKHPHWSYRQARCVLYWQGSVNKNLRYHCQQFHKLYPETVVTTCPEAMGVNVIETARYCGLPVETKPTRIVYKIAIAGSPQRVA